MGRLETNCSSQDSFLAKYFVGFDSTASCGARWRVVCYAHGDRPGCSLEGRHLLGKVTVEGLGWQEGQRALRNSSGSSLKGSHCGARARRRPSNEVSL